MVRGQPDEGGGLSADAVEGVLAGCERARALALGPGLGRGEGAASFARALAAAAPIPMVLDADGLNAHAGRLADLSSRSAATILTPHAGELGRLLELESADIERERLRYAREASRLAQADRRAEGGRHPRRRAGRHGRDQPRRKPGASPGPRPPGRATSSQVSSRHSSLRARTRSPRRARACGCTRRPAGSRRSAWEPPRESSPPT